MFRGLYFLDFIKKGKVYTNDEADGLDVRETKQYPLSPRMLKPASNPKYYDDLIKELDEAPRRSWLQSKIKKLRAMVRFS